MPAPDDPTEHLLEARRLVEAARTRYDLLASTVLPLHHADAAAASKDFRNAVGDISPEEAFQGLVDWMGAHGVQPLPGHGCDDPVVTDGCSE